MSKVWLSYEQQVGLLQKRGLTVEDPDYAAEFLSRVNYYRISGYFRYWQVDPENGNNNFMQGSSFNKIASLYEAEKSLIAVCYEVLHPIEVLLRTRFAYHYANRVSEIGGFALGEGFTQHPDTSRERVEEHALKDLDRSKETFVQHYRTSKHDGAADYSNTPIWVAVEALSFGSLSRLIEASGASGVLDDIASSLNVSRAHLPGQIRAFVYIRNRIAHQAKLWNHAVIDKPGLNRNSIRGAKKKYRSFSDDSIYKIFVAINEVASNSKIQNDWLANRVEPILSRNPLLAAGISNPKKYGDMPPELLV